jgi:hypothetical protein
MPTSRIGLNATAAQASKMQIRSPAGEVRKYGAWQERPEDSAKAIRAIGTDALSLYLRKLTRTNERIKSEIWRAARAVGFKGFLFQEVHPERE